MRRLAHRDGGAGATFTPQGLSPNRHRTTNVRADKEETEGNVKRTEKEAQVESLRDQFDRSGFSVVAAYKGLSVADVTRLRDELRKVDGRFRVVRNTLARRAVAEGSAAVLTDHFKGPMGVVFAFGDAAATAKVVRAFAKDMPAFDIGAGVLEGELLSANQVAQIADLPSREELLGRLAAAMNSPVRNLAGVLSGTLRGLVYALSAVAEKKAA